MHDLEREFRDAIADSDDDAALAAGLRVLEQFYAQATRLASLEAALREKQELLEAMVYVLGHTPQTPISHFRLRIEAALSPQNPKDLQK